MSLWKSHFKKEKPAAIKTSSFVKFVAGPACPGGRSASPGAASSPTATPSGDDEQEQTVRLKTCMEKRREKCKKRPFTFYFERLREELQPNEKCTTFCAKKSQKRPKIRVNSTYALAPALFLCKNIFFARNRRKISTLRQFYVKIAPNNRNFEK